MSGSDDTDGDDVSVPGRQELLKGLAAGGLALAGLSAISGSASADDDPCYTKSKYINGQLHVKHCCKSGRDEYCSDWHEPGS